MLKAWDGLENSAYYYVFISIIKFRTLSGEQKEFNLLKIAIKNLLIKFTICKIANSNFKIGIITKSLIKC